MRRYSSPYASSFSFGPGPLSTALKALIGANVVLFVASSLYHPLVEYFGLQPSGVLLHPWQPLSYMFVHGGVFHIFFNMFALWMFGGELERLWGTRFFLKFYFVTGIGAALLTVCFAYLPVPWATAYLRDANIVGASGAIYGLLLAYAMYFPERPIYMYMLFPIPAKIFVAIMGGIELLSSISGVQGGVANATHLGGLIVAYLYLKSARANPVAELKYRYLKWKINRVRRKFDVYSGGRADDWDRRVH